MLYTLTAAVTAGLFIGPAAPADAAEKVRTFTYKTTDQAELKIRVHYPADWSEDDKRPAIVFFFGGGWNAGTVEQFVPQAEYLAGRGMVAARADYRVRSRHGVTPDKCVEDAHSAMRWIRGNARVLGVDPDRIVSSGGSAGGHLAACTGCTPAPKVDGENADVSSKPNAMLLFNPVLDFTLHEKLTDRLGGDQKLARSISPTLHLTKQTPPALILFGTADRLLAHGRGYVARSKEVGNRAEMFLAEGAGHGFFNRPPWLAKTIARSDEFLTSLGYLEAKPPQEPPAKRPNVVFILTDDQRSDQLSCEGHPFLKTPHMDRIATEGARFANMFVTTSLCSPSRASFLSGLYAHSHGVVNNFTDYPADLPSFPRRLQAAGYETAYIGKWHMGEQSDELRPGFDYWVTHKGQGKYYDTTFNVNGERTVKEGYYTHRVTDMAADWLSERGDKPFMLILGHKAPHTPFTPEKQYERLFDDVKIKYPDTAFALQSKPEWVRQRLVTWHGIYGPIFGFREEFPDTSPESVKEFRDFVLAYTATIKSVDDSVGRIYKLLEDAGRLDDTLLLFAGDNGFFLGEHGMTDKRTMHEPSIRVPLLARYPELIRPGTVIEQQVLNVDLAPSVLEICGAEPLKKIHGRSWKQLLEGRTEGWRTSWYYEYNYEKQFPYTPNVRGVRTDRYKYVRYPHGDGSPDRHMAELYDLKSDPGETKNLIDDPAHARRVVELRAELKRLMKQSGALPDKMPLDEGIKTELPDESIQ